MKSTIKRQQREEQILLSLKKLDYLTRSQIQTLHRLGTARNASRVLQQLSDYISWFRDGENVYYLNAEGRDRVNSEKICTKTPQARHYIMRNSIYIAFGCPSSWEIEMKFEVPGKVKLITDAMFRKDGTYHLVEVDHTQKMSVNRKKIENYKKLIELKLMKNPKLIWITTTEYRRKQLLKACNGLDAQVFVTEDFH